MHMKKSQNWNIYFLIIIILTTAIFIGVTLKFTNDIFINLIFVLIMFIIISFDYIFFLRHTNEVNADFNRAINKVKEYSEKDDGVDLFLNDSNIFQNSMVRCAISEYKKEVKRIYRKDQASVMPNINDYINAELIDNVVKAEISDQISGAMTGLGILGTFIGLTIGLNKFSLGSDIDTTQMQESISGLLEGIKTAFMTSIFGVIYSLVFNFLYKRIYIQAYENMNDFIICYENELVSSPQNDLLTLFVRNQEIQTDSLSGFAENISRAIAEQMNTIFRPTMDYFNTSVDKFLEKSVYAHNESLDAIVSAFIDNMNASLGNQFENLGNTISKLNANQIENNARIQKVVDNICQNANNLILLNDKIENSVNIMSSFIEKIDAYQAAMNQTNEKLFERINVINDYNDRQAEILTHIETAQTNFNQTADMIRNSLEDFNKISTEFSEKSSKSYDELTNAIGIAYGAINNSITSFNEISKSLVTEMQSVITNELSNLAKMNADQCAVYTNSIKHIVESSNEKIIESGKASEKIISESFNNVKSIIDGISNISGEQSKDLVESAKSIAAESRSAIESCRIAMDEQTKTTEKAMSDIIKSASEAIAKINTSSDSQNKQITESFTKAVSESQKILDVQITKANEISENMSINMTRSAAALDKAYKELENDISRVLRTTFDSFDSGMADISSHLSGTIKSNEQSIEKLNDYMEEIPVKLYKIIEKMMTELSDVINELKKVQYTVSESNKEYSNEIQVTGDR